MRQERWGLRDAAPIHREAVSAWLTLMLSSGSSTLPIQCKNHNFSVATTITVGMYRQNHRFCRAMGMTAPPSVSNTWKNQFKGLLPQNWHLPLRKNWQNSLNMMPLVQSWAFPAEECSLHSISHCHITMQKSAADIYKPFSINFILFRFWLHFTMELWDVF